MKNGNDNKKKNMKSVICVLLSFVKMIRVLDIIDFF